LQQPPVSCPCHVSWHPRHKPSGGIYRQWKMQPAACNEPVDWLQTVSAAATGATATLGSWVLKGCNRPLYAAFVMSAGTHSIHQQGEYVARPQCMQHYTSNQLACPTWPLSQYCCYPAHAAGVRECPAALTSDISHLLQHR
jgi:hypothetical protein